MTEAAFELLKPFVEGAPAARKATWPLARRARVNLMLPDGPAHFDMEAGAPVLARGPCPDPDFTLSLPEGAVRRLTAMAGDGVGDLGVEFFKLVLERDPDLRVHVRIDAPTPRLLANGYLGVLAQGGLRVTFWLLRKGVKNPLAAIDRLRRR